MPRPVLGADDRKVHKMAIIPALSEQEFPVFQWEKDSKTRKYIFNMIDNGKSYTKTRLGKEARD